MEGAPPEMPDKDAQRGDMPGGQAPQNGGDMPDMQNGGDFHRGPGGPEAVPGDTQFSDQMRGQNEMGGGGRGDGGQFMPWGQNEDRPQDAAASEISTVSPGTSALLGVSVLFLLAGIFAALKVKH